MDTRTRSIETGLRWGILAVCLALCCLLGFLTTYVLVVLAAIGALYLLVKGHLQFDFVAKVLLGVFLVIAVVVVVDARQAHDYLDVVNFIALLAYAPIASLCARGANPRSAETIAILALVGALAGCALAIVGVLVFGLERAGTGNTDPIRLADTALMLGFFALIGVLVTRGRWRLVYIAGPILAVMTIYLAGARGALVALVPMLIAAIFMLVRRRALAWGSVAVCAVLVLGLVAYGELVGARAANVVDVARSLLSGSSPTDSSASIRLALYQAGWRSFLDAPLLGHGWAGAMPSLVPYLSEAYRDQAALPHMHNEFLNFAVFGGVVGIAIYLVLLALPILACLRTPRDSLFPARLYGCAMLTLGYFVLGLPDTMLSFELHTALYVGWLALLLNYCCDQSSTTSTVR